MAGIGDRMSGLNDVIRRKERIPDRADAPTSRLASDGVRDRAGPPAYLNRASFNRQ